MVDAYLGRHFLPQPNRYHLEMELALAPLMAMALWRIGSRIPPRIRIALAAMLLGIALDQTASLRRAMRQNTAPVDLNAGIEARVARWFEQHLPGRRVMVPGSIAQWFNVFTASPQLSGGSFSTSPNWNQQEAMTKILTAMKPADLERAVLWAKAFGIQALAASGLKSSEFWKGQSSTRFEPLLPLLWSEEDTAIYRVPQRSPSLAHVVPAGAPGELGRYVAALDDPALPLATLRWNGFRGASIEADVRPGQVVSVQTTYHPGWHAAANGRAAPVRRDGLGLLVVEPECNGGCSIELTYDGGIEYRVCRALSLFTACALLISALWYGGMVRVWRRAK
jgi:hypothetical protein